LRLENNGIGLHLNPAEKERVLERMLKRVLKKCVLKESVLKSVLKNRVLEERVLKRKSEVNFLLLSYVK
jgi:hypothetical protein